MLPRIGLNIVPVMGERIGEIAAAAERLGYESIWVGERVVNPVRMESQYHSPTRGWTTASPYFEPFSALAFAAAHTSRLRLGTGVLVLPLHDPMLTARAIVSVDIFSKGRLELGVAAGWMREEYDVLGRDFATRGARLDEFLDVLDRLFSDERPEYHGACFDFPPLGFEPKPAQKPRPPILLGGDAPAAIRRIAVRADGWYGRASSEAQVAALPSVISTIQERRRAAGREALPFEITLNSTTPKTRAEIEHFATLGVSRVVLTPWGPSTAPDPRDPLEVLEATAVQLGLTALE